MPVRYSKIVLWVGSRSESIDSGRFSLVPFESDTLKFRMSCKLFYLSLDLLDWVSRFPSGVVLYTLTGAHDFASILSTYIYILDLLRFSTLLPCDSIIVLGPIAKHPPNNHLNICPYPPFPHNFTIIPVTTEPSSSRLSSPSFSPPASASSSPEPEAHSTALSLNHNGSTITMRGSNKPTILPRIAQYPYEPLGGSQSKWRGYLTWKRVAIGATLLVLLFWVASPGRSGGDMINGEWVALTQPEAAARRPR
jgi:hypothetical protein